MLEIISLGVGLCGILAIVFGAKRRMGAAALSEPAAQGKARKNGVVLIVLGLLLIGLAAYNLMMVHGIIKL